MLTPEIRTYYDDQYDESDRLTRTIKGRLELARTQQIVRRNFPLPPATVVDIGGGTGIHTQWMTEHGYDVELLDAVPRHVDAALGNGHQASLGDARELPWEPDTFDAALVAGPLYHLPDAENRLRVLREAHRVVRPGGIVAVATLNRFAPLFGATVANNLTKRFEMVKEIMATGRCTRPAEDPWVTTAYYHSAASLRMEMRVSGFERIGLTGIGGPGAWLAVSISAHHGEHPDGWPETLTDEPPLANAVLAAELSDDYPELIHASNHLMAVGRVPG